MAMTIKEGTTALAGLITDMQQETTRMVWSMGSAETAAKLRDLKRSSDELRVAVENLQRAQLAMLSIMRERELTAEELQKAGVAK